MNTARALIITEKSIIKNTITVLGRADICKAFVIAESTILSDKQDYVCTDRFVRL